MPTPFRQLQPPRPIVKQKDRTTNAVRVKKNAYSCQLRKETTFYPPYAALHAAANNGSQHLLSRVSGPRPRLKTRCDVDSSVVALGGGGGRGTKRPCDHFRALAEGQQGYIAGADGTRIAEEEYRTTAFSHRGQ